MPLEARPAERQTSAGNAKDCGKERDWFGILESSGDCRRIVGRSSSDRKMERNQRKQMSCERLTNLNRIDKVHGSGVRLSHS